MTEWELMDYLKNLYKVPVADIKMKVSPPILGKDHRGLTYISKPECRIARVLLDHGYYFEFPNLFEKPVDESSAQDSNVVSKQAYREELNKEIGEEAEMARDWTEQEKLEYLNSKRRFWQRLPGKTSNKWM